MPTSTFFRLPEEKRQRMINAAWEEFEKRSFASASINQIIRNAHIPRGSFYQYFTDKSELFWYLLEGVRDYFSDMFLDALRAMDGDMFAVLVCVFDRIISPQGRTDPTLTRLLRVLCLNHGMDLQESLMRSPCLLPNEFLEQVKLTDFRKKDPEFVTDVFFLIIPPLARAVMETLRNPEQWEYQRRKLQDRIEIVRFGSLA